MPKKASATSNKSELNLLLKSIDRRMQDFEEAVQELKDMKENISSMETDIEQKRKINEEAMKELERELDTNVLKAIQSHAYKLGKVILSEEELSELKAENSNLKIKYNNYVKESETAMAKKIAEKVENAKKIFQLENDRENAHLVSDIESYKKNVVSMESLINRMTQELESQKKLTAEIAKSNSSNRPWNQQDK